MIKLLKNNYLPLKLSLLLGLSACSQTLERQTCLPLDQGVNYCLAPLLPIAQKPLAQKNSPQNPPDKAFNQTPTTQQFQAVITKDDRSTELLIQVDFNGENLTMVGVAPLGQALFTITYDGNKLVSNQNVLLGKEFKAEYLVAIMQLVFWPQSQLNARLQGGIINTFPCNKTYCRRLYYYQGESPPDPLEAPKETQPSLVSIVYSKANPWQANIDVSIEKTAFSLKLTPLS